MKQHWLKESISIGLMLQIFFYAVNSSAQNKSKEVGIGGVAANLIGAEMNLHNIIQAICITAGVGLIISAIIKYKKYRKNPYEVPLSSVFTNLVIGILLIILAFIPLMI